MWITDKKDRDELERVKRDRPACVNTKHTFIEYQSESKKKCVDCNYEEDTIIKE
jgi:hypothetical protein